MAEITVDVGTVRQVRADKRFPVTAVGIFRCMRCAYLYLIYVLYVERLGSLRCVGREKHGSLYREERVFDSARR